MPSTTIKPASHEHLQQLTAQVQAAAGQDMSFLTLLVELQVKLIGGISGAVFVIRQNDEPRMVTVYPLAADGHVRVDPDRVKVLRDCVDHCCKAGRLSVFRVGMGGRVYHAVCTPLELDGRIDGVTVVMTTPEDKSELTPHLAHVLWAGRMYCGHISERRLRHQMRQAGESRKALAALGAAHQAGHFQECAMAVCNQLAVDLEAARVSLGWTHGNTVRLIAISDTEHMDRRQELSQQIEAAMEECFDQGRAVVAPSSHQDGDDAWLAQAVSRCHHELISDDGQQTVCSVPLRYRDEVLGVLTVERPARLAFDSTNASHLQAIGDLVTPRLSDRDQDDRPIAVKLWHSSRRWTGRLVGPEHVGWKLIGLFAAAVLVWACLFNLPYRINAEFEVEPTSMTIYSAPFETTIESVSVRKGDRVVAGQELARLRADEKEKQLATAKGELRVAEIAYGQALEKSSRLAAQWKAQCDARQAEVQLYEMLLEQATIRASQPGVVLVGEWIERQGARVEKGTRLFNVAPLRELRVVIHVDERDIDRVKLAGTGELAPRNAPSKTIGFTVTRIVPAGRVKSVGDAGRVQNVFDVFADLRESPDGVQLQPGMEGAAKIDAGRRRVIWILTHKLVDYLRLAFWW